MVALGAPQETIEKMIDDAPIVMKDGLSHEYAEKYAEAVRASGGDVEVQEQEIDHTPIPEKQSITIASFEAFTMCPECGMKQQKHDTCVRCGHKLPHD